MTLNIFLIGLMALVCAVTGLLLGIFSALRYRAFWQLRDDWRECYTWFSTWLTVAATAMSGYLLAAPETIAYWWEILPPEMKERVPENYVLYINVALFISAQLAKLVKQQKKIDAPTNATDRL